jgi:uncharacterized small protein (DUF1192 family)
MARDDDDANEPLKPVEPTKNLEVMSIAALNLYLEELDVEIDRVRQMIEMKQKARSSADSLFKQ